MAAEKIMILGDKIRFPNYKPENLRAYLPQEVLAIMLHQAFLYAFKYLDFFHKQTTQKN